MEVKAVAMNTGISARKARLLIDLVKGKKVDEALAILKFAPSPSARAVAKVVKSAAANAENNFQMEPAELRVVKAYANQARIMKRFRPVARGRAHRINKRSSHITVIVAEAQEV